MQIVCVIYFLFKVFNISFCSSSNPFLVSNVLFIFTLIAISNGRQDIRAIVIKNIPVFIILILSCFQNGNKSASYFPSGKNGLFTP